MNQQKKERREARHIVQAEAKKLLGPLATKRQVKMLAQRAVNQATK